LADEVAAYASIEQFLDTGDRCGGCEGCVDFYVAVFVFEEREFVGLGELGDEVQNERCTRSAVITSLKIASSVLLCRCPWSYNSIFKYLQICNVLVFPEPKKPVMMVMGIMAAGIVMRNERQNPKSKTSKSKLQHSRKESTSLFAIAVNRSCSFSGV
jgi:uncharacterized glyoxalase superfamily protein PhnB